MQFDEVMKTEITFMNKEEYYAWHNTRDMLSDIIFFEEKHGRPEGKLSLDAQTALNAMDAVMENIVGIIPKDVEEEVYTHEEAFDELFDEEEEEPTVYKVYLESCDTHFAPKYVYLGESVDLNKAILIGLDYVRGKGWNVECERYFNDENGKGMNIDYGAWDSFIWITPAPPESWWNGEKGEED